MQAQGLKTCQYCEYLWNSGCPFWPAQGMGRKISEPACGQFRSLKDMAMFKNRKQLDEMILVKKQPIKKDKKLKRNLDF